MGDPVVGLMPTRSKIPASNRQGQPNGNAGHQVSRKYQKPIWPTRTYSTQSPDKDSPNRLIKTPWSNMFMAPYRASASRPDLVKETTR